MLNYLKLESTKHWNPVDQKRRREETLERARIASERYLCFALFTGFAVALALAVLLGAFDTVDVAGPAQRLGQFLKVQ